MTPVPATPLPCPFCGKEGFSADGKTARCITGEQSPIQSCGGSFVRIPLAAWNTRPAAQDARVEALEEVIAAAKLVDESTMGRVCRHDQLGLGSLSIGTGKTYFACALVDLHKALAALAKPGVSLKEGL